jgi:hypothetical protein
MNQLKEIEMSTLQKCLYFFFPFRDKSDFPVFDERWIFFSQAMDNEQLYIDASRIMQNIQDVENSKMVLYLTV